MVEDEAVTVRFIFLAYMAGYSLDGIAEILTDKERKTLTGRTDWNGSMVRNIMTNERRWGDLEARKTIVIDYVKGKTVKNTEIRDSAYVPNHHEGIVSKEIAMAVKMVANSDRKLEGVPDISVIEEGGLKGFVSVCPAWGGVDRDTYLDISRSVYTEEEYAQVERQARIISGKEHTNVLSKDFTGYEVPNSAMFIDGSSATLTFTRRQMKFNKKAHERFDDCEHIEMFYHPLLQAIIIRTSDGTSSNAIRWKNEDGKQITSFTAPAFCGIVYEQMDWIEDYGFRFRGITRQRGDQKFMMFFLDEPLILVGKGGVKTADGTAPGTNYIPYRNADISTDNEEDKKLRFGMSYGLRKMRNGIMDSLGARDVSAKGTVRTNPLIGEIPSRDEVLQELDELLLSM
jgi:hypothetical protein